MSVTSLLRRPGAFIPFGMSFAALLLIMAVLATAGVTQQPDEGAPARAFQLLILLQVPIIAAFAVKWLPRDGLPALLVLLLQLVAASIPVVFVAWLETGGFR